MEPEPREDEEQAAAAAAAEAPEESTVVAARVGVAGHEIAADTTTLDVLEWGLTAAQVREVAGALPQLLCLRELVLDGVPVSGSTPRHGDFKYGVKAVDADLEMFRALCEALRALQWLTSLSLGGCYLGPQALALLADLIRATAAINSLAVGSNPIGDEAMVQLLDGLKDVSLTSLDISKTKSGVSTATKLAELLAEETAFKAVLASLNLSGNTITDFDKDISGLVALGEAIVPSKTLTSVDLSKCGIKVKGVTEVAKFISAGAALAVVTCDSTGDPKYRNGGPKSYTLNVQDTSLDLSSKNFGPADATLLAVWIQRPEVSAVLTRVNVLSNPIGADGADALIEVFDKNINLRTLLGIEEGVTEVNLSKKNVDPGQAKILAAELKASRAVAVLTTLRCGSNPGMIGESDQYDNGRLTPDVHIETLQQLLNALKPSGVTDLDISAIGIGPTGADRVADYVCDARVLTTLRCGSNPGMIGELDQYGRLKTPDVHIETLQQLLNALKPSGVTDLDISAIGIGPTGADRVADYVCDARAALASLNLSGNAGVGMATYIDPINALWTLYSGGGDIISREQYTKYVVEVNGYSGLDDAEWAQEMAALEGDITIGIHRQNFDLLYTKYNLDATTDAKKAQITGTWPLGEGIENSSITQLDISNCGIRPAICVKLASSLVRATPFNAAVTSVNCLKNPLGDDGLATLIAAVETSSVGSICGLVEEQTSVDWSGQDFSPFDCKIIAADFSFRRFSAVLASLTMSGNFPAGRISKYNNGKAPWLPGKDFDEWTELCDAVQGSQITEWNISDCYLGPDAMTILSTRLSAAVVKKVVLSNNFIFGSNMGYDNEGDAITVHDIDADQSGWIALCGALPGSPVEELIVADIGMGVTGVTSLAKAISSMAVLAHLAIGQNKIGSEGGTALVEAIKTSNLESISIGKDLVLPIKGKSDSSSLDASNQDINPGDVIILTWWLTTPASAALNQLTCDSTGVPAEYDRRGRLRGGTGPRTYTLTTGEEIIDMSRKNLGPADVTLLTVWIQRPEVSAVVTSINCLANKFGDEGLATLLKAIEGTSVRSLCGLTEGQTTADFSGQNLGPIDCKIMSAEFEFRGFIAVLKKVALSQNSLFGADEYGDHTIDADQSGWAALCDALPGSPVEELDVADVGMGVTGVTSLAKAMSAGAVLTTLRCGSNPGMVGELDRHGDLETPDVHIGALQQLLNALKPSGVTDLDISAIAIGPTGANRVADYVRDARAVVKKASRAVTALKSLTVSQNAIGGPCAVRLVDSAKTSVTVKKGVFAAVDGRWGKVVMDPDSGMNDVKLTWLDDGTKSSYIKAGELKPVVGSRTDLVEDYSHIEQFGQAITQLSSLDMSNCNFTPASIKIFTSSVSWAKAAVTALNVISNAIGEPGADSLIQVFQSNGHLQTMLGIEDGTTTLDVSGERYGTQKLDTGCAKLLATEFSAGRRTRAITKVVLHDNRDLCDAGLAAIWDALPPHVSLVPKFQRCGLTTVPKQLFDKPDTTAIDLSDNDIDHLPWELLTLTNLTELKLEGNERLRTVHDIKRQQGVQGVFSYLRDLYREEPTWSYSLKMILAGPSMAGKSSLLNGLVAGKADLTTPDNRTVGLDIKLLQLSDHRRRTRNGLQLQFSCYDAGGHDEYADIHNLFFSLDSLYALLCDLSKPRPEDTNKQAQIDETVSKLVQWAASIQAYAPGSVVQLVGSHADEVVARPGSSREKTAQDTCDFYLERVKTVLDEQREEQRRELRELEKTLPRDWRRSPAIGKGSSDHARALHLRKQINYPLQLAKQALSVSAKTLENFDALREALVDAAFNSRAFPEFGTLQPKSYQEIKEHIDVLGKTKPALTWSELRSSLAQKLQEPAQSDDVEPEPEPEHDSEPEPELDVELDLPEPEPELELEPQPEPQAVATKPNWATEGWWMRNSSSMCALKAWLTLVDIPEKEDAIRLNFGQSVSLANLANLHPWPASAPAKAITVAWLQKNDLSAWKATVTQYIQADGQGLDDLKSMFGDYEAASTEDKEDTDLAQMMGEMQLDEKQIVHFKSALERLSAHDSWSDALQPEGLDHLLLSATLADMNLRPDQDERFHNAVKDLRLRAQDDFDLYGTVLPKWPRWQPRRRVSLCIGNDSYGGRDALPNCVADARAMCAMACDMRQKIPGAPGCEVLIENASLEDMKKAVMELCRQHVWPGSLVTFFFSGHGAEHDGTSYLLPLGIPAGLHLEQLAERAKAVGVSQEQVQQTVRDAPDGTQAAKQALVDLIVARSGTLDEAAEATLRVELGGRNQPEHYAEQAVSVSWVLQQLNASIDVVSLLFLDCCRANPRDSTFKAPLTAGSMGKSLGDDMRRRTDAQVFMGLACDPGTVAEADDDGTYSRYTQALLNHLPVPGESLETCMKAVAREVRDKTSQRQRTWQNSCVHETVILMPGKSAEERAMHELAREKSRLRLENEQLKQKQLAGLSDTNVPTHTLSRMPKDTGVPSTLARSLDDDPELLNRAMLFLRARGAVLYYDHVPSLRDRVFIRPQWLVDVIKELVRHDLREQLQLLDPRFHNVEVTRQSAQEFLESGTLRIGLLPWLWRELNPSVGQDPALMTGLMELLVQLGIVIAQPKRAGEPVWLLPMRLPATQPDDVPTLSGEALTCVGRRYDFRVAIPSGLLSNFLGKALSLCGTESTTASWRHGFTSVQDSEEVSIQMHDTRFIDFRARCVQAQKHSELLRRLQLFEKTLTTCIARLWRGTSYQVLMLGPGDGTVAFEECTRAQLRGEHTVTIGSHDVPLEHLLIAPSGFPIDADVVQQLETLRFISSVHDALTGDLSDLPMVQDFLSGLESTTTTELGGPYRATDGGSEAQWSARLHNHGIGDGTIAGVNPATIEEKYHRDGRGRALGLLSFLSRVYASTADILEAKVFQSHRVLCDYLLRPFPWLRRAIEKLAVEHGLADIPALAGLFPDTSGVEPEPESQDTLSSTGTAAGSDYKSCLDRPFVQLEVREAKSNSKPVITVFEEERRRQAFFDYSAAWGKYGCGEWEWVLNIDSVTYRRDKHEAQAMLTRIVEKMVGPACRPSASPLNAPGHWDIFLSHAQAAAGDQVKTLCFLLTQRGYTVWYDNEMSNRSTAAMEEGVRHSSNFLLFLSGDPELGAAGASPTKTEEGVPPDAATQPEPAAAPQDIDSWLAAVKLERYCEAIKEYGYDSFEALRGATEADIKEMMVDPDIKMKKPHQRLMLTAWQELTRGS